MSVLDQSQIAAVNTSYSTAPTYSLWYAQTFKSGYNGSLDKVVLYARALTGFSTEPDMVVEIRETSGGNPTSTILATETILWANIPVAAGGAAFDIEFSNPAYLDEGVTYAIVVYPSPMGTGVDIVNSIQFRGASGNLYVYGTKQSSTDDSSWSETALEDFYFQTYMTEWNNTLWYDMNTDLRVLSEYKYDINCDIRVVNTKVVLRDINSIIYTAGGELKDINCDIRVLEEYDKLYDINCDIRVSSGIDFNDITCDIRVNSAGGVPNDLTDIDCDIRVLSRNIYDINCDIRVQEDNDKVYDMNSDIRVRAIGDTEPTPVGLEGFRVYLDGNDVTDVNRDSLNYEWTMNESPSSATFRIARKSDDYNETIAAVAQAVNTNLPIEIKFNGKLRWYGYVMSIEVQQSGESVVVNCLDRKHKIQEKLYDISYGRKWESLDSGDHSVITGDYATTGEAITGVLNELVTDGIISSYSGVPTGIITEYNETAGAPSGTLITELLDVSGNFYWNVTPSGVLKIYESSNGTQKSLPLQTEGNHIHLYDILNYNLKLNDRSNLVTELEVNMGTESEDVKASYKLVKAGGLQPAWNRDYDNLFNDFYGDSETINDYRKSGKLPYITTGDAWLEARDAKPEVGRKYTISNWTEGSFIDDNFDPLVRGYNNNKINGWSWGGETLTLSQPLLEIKKTIKFSTGMLYNDGYIVTYQFKQPNLIGKFYRKEDVTVATESTVFDVTWDGIAGTGAKRKATFSQLGIRESIGWSVYEDGQLVYKSEPGYNDTAYATDRANLMLSRMNDPITEGNIDLTFDAFEYYGLDIGDRANILQTNETDIYNGNNGFPLDIHSIRFDAKEYKVSLGIKHNRNFKASVNYR